MNKEEIFNEIGKLWLSFNIDIKSFKVSIEESINIDEYSLREKKKRFKVYLDRFSEGLKETSIGDDFLKFRNCVLNAIDDELYLREIRDKYNDDIYNR